jgi:hypothetical protein
MALVNTSAISFNKISVSSKLSGLINHNGKILACQSASEA